MATAAGVAVANITVAQSLLGDIADTLGVGAGAAGVVVSATQLGYACGLVLVVPLGDVIEPRRLVAMQSFLSAGALRWPQPRRRSPCCSAPWPSWAPSQW